jgi:hypothetical protein
MHIIIWPDKRSLAGFVETEGEHKGKVFWRGATDMLDNKVPATATQAELVQYMETLAAEKGGTVSKVPSAN